MRVFSLILSLALLSPAAFALDENHPAGRFDHLVKYRAGGVVGIDAKRLSSLPDQDPGKQAWSRLNASGSDPERIWLDDRSGLPSLATLSGLTWYDRASGTAPDVDGLAARALEYLRTNRSVLGDWDDQLVLDRDASGSRGADVWQLRFSQVVDGLPVEGAHYDFHLAHGNLVTVGARRLAPVRISTDPSLLPNEARAKLESYLRTTDDDRLTDLSEAELRLIPVSADPSAEKWTGPRGEGIAHRLIWRFRFTDLDGIATWTGEVDAHTGEIVAFYDDTRYDRVEGDVNPISDDGQCHAGGCPEPNYPLTHVDYSVDGGPVQYTDEYGRYQGCSQGQTIETNLDGQFFFINDQCGPISETATCDDPLDLGVSGLENCGVAPGASAGNTDAARSAYYSLELVHRKAKFWAPSIAWLDEKVECQTNVDSTCNANWANNRIRMYRAGNGCGNTSQIQGVVVHEWGHGFDENDGGGFDETSEAYADVVAIFEARDSCVGRGFRPNQTCTGFGDACLSCTGIRDMDWDARQNRTPATPSGFITDYCTSSGGGACGRHNHCESYVPSETIFDLATRDLPAMGIDADSAWQLAERLWYQSRPGSGGPIFNCTLPASDSCTTASWYHQLRVQDDDDGDLSNGTPHAAAIFAAFDRHDIACGSAGDPENQNTSSCPTLDAPLAGFTAATNSVDVWWDPVPGASSYRVYRNENGCNRGQFPVTEVGAGTTNFVDDGLTNTLPVFYRVQAVGSNPACESPVSTCLEAAAQPLNGKIRLDRGSYGCSHTIGLEVNDANHPAASMTVEIWSDSEPTPETVVLNESSIGSGRFTGSIDTTSGAAGADGLLSVASGDGITARYVDLDDGAGGSNVVTEEFAEGDCVAPRITQVHESEVTDLQATIAWSTDKPTNSRVWFGESLPPTAEASAWFLVDEHAVDLRGLNDCTRYYYAVEGSDAAGNVVTDDKGGAYYSFETYFDFGDGPLPCHQGRIEVQAVAVGCDSSFTVQASDGDLNQNPGLVETVAATLTSSTESTPETVVLTETGPDTAVFTAVVPTQAGAPVSGDGIVQVAHGDLLTAVYLDDDDGTGVQKTAFGTAPIDCTGSDYVSITVEQVTDTTATIHWVTDEPTTGYVDWGMTTGLGTVMTSDTLKLDHSVLVENIAECGQAYFRVGFTNDRGYSSVADAGGVPFQLSTGTVGGALLRDDFESDLGWSLPGEWEVDQPLGLGSAPGDPVTAFNGNGVLGHDLTGLGSHPGDYEPSMVETATSPSIDGSTLTQVELQFERWLNVANGSRAYLELKNSAGGWLTLWSSPTAGGPTEAAWSHISHDVSQYAAGNPDFQVRFRQQSYLGTSFHAGWNVDRFILRDATLPAFESCGGCGGTPTFAGVGSASDDDPCADSGVTLSWIDPPAWGTGFGGTFSVYRNTQPGFTPSPANRVATGVGGTTWTDLGAPTGVTLHYLVRAESDESCGSGPNNGGMVDDNVVYVSATDQTAQTPPGNVGNTLVVEQIDGVHARLNWAAAANAAGYHVYRSPIAGGGFDVIAQPAGTLHEDVGALTDHRDGYYLVVGSDACGNESND